MTDISQPRIPGVIPTARLSLTAYLMPDGRVSHYEIEGRSPDGALTHARAQASTSTFYHDEAWVETVSIFTEWVAAALEELAAAHTALDRTERPRD